MKKNAHAVALGKKGGLKTKKKGRKYYREIGKKGAMIRWGKDKKKPS